jgi:RNA polymerase sigma factor (sigma-70 family)
MRAVDGKATLDRLDLERCVSSLPEGQREVLILFHIEGYSHDEIADLLDIAPGTSKSRLFEARRALRRQLVSEPAGSGGTL